MNNEEIIEKVSVDVKDYEEILMYTAKKMIEEALQLQAEDYEKKNKSFNCSHCHCMLKNKGIIINSYETICGDCVEELDNYKEKIKEVRDEIKEKITFNNKILRNEKHWLFREIEQIFSKHFGDNSSQQDVKREETKTTSEMNITALEDTCPSDEIVSQPFNSSADNSNSKCCKNCVHSKECLKLKLDRNCCEYFKSKQNSQLKTLKKKK